MLYTFKGAYVIYCHCRGCDYVFRGVDDAFYWFLKASCSVYDESIFVYKAGFMVVWVMWCEIDL